jgi:hypothetical protein
VIPLLRKELRELATGNSLWALTLLLSPLGGYSFIQAVALYAEASRPALSIPELACQFSPFDRVLVPTLGGFYLAITLLFPFIAIRRIASEKASGGLKLLVQLPYRLIDLVAAKFAALVAAWLIALIPVFSALVWWGLIGAHLDTRETRDLDAGPSAFYGILIGAIPFLAAALTEGGARAAILALAVTLGSWVLDLAALDREWRLEPAGCGFIDLSAQTLSTRAAIGPDRVGHADRHSGLRWPHCNLAAPWRFARAPGQKGCGTDPRLGRDRDRRRSAGEHGSRRHCGSAQFVSAGRPDPASPAPRAVARNGSPGLVGSPAR